MTMRILLAGGAGCLGSNLLERWLPAGEEVLVIDNFATGQRAVLPDRQTLRIVEGTIADRDLVNRCFGEFRPSHVVHSAAAYKDPQDWREDLATNTTGTINLADAARQCGVKRFVNFQTALCYGHPRQIPIPADHPCAPFTSYGISKLAGEQYLRIAGLPLVSLRIANVTGPRLSIGPIPSFYRRLKAGQSCFCSETVRDFVDMSDFLSLMDIVMNADAPTGIYNASTGIGHSIKEVFDLVAEHLQVRLDTPPPLVPPGSDDIPAVVLDASETERAFGWCAKVSFRDSVLRMLSWYDDHGISNVYSHLTTPAPGADALASDPAT